MKNRINLTYKYALEFKKRYPETIAWRLRQNASVIEKYLNPGEKVLYAFCAQKSSSPFSMLSTAVVALTNKRILIGRKRVVFGYFLDSITPDLFNDLKVLSGFIWGKIHIDTAKELVELTNISKKSLDEIETKLTSFMMEEKKKYPINNN